jgi:hypothetical protein
MVAATAAFLTGFYAALGAWTAYKITGNVDKVVNPPSISKPVDPIPVIIKQVEPIIVKHVDQVLDTQTEQNTEE